MSENEEKHEEQDEKQNASVLDVNVNTEKQDEDPAEETATAEKDAAETEETAAAVKEIQDKFVRLQADFANFKKRSSAERLQVANVIRGRWSPTSCRSSIILNGRCKCRRRNKMTM